MTDYSLERIYIQFLLVAVLISVGCGGRPHSSLSFSKRTTKTNFCLSLSLSQRCPSSIGFHFRVLPHVRTSLLLYWYCTGIEVKSVPRVQSPPRYSFVPGFPSFILFDVSSNSQADFARVSALRRLVPISSSRARQIRQKATDPLTSLLFPLSSRKPRKLIHSNFGASKNPNTLLIHPTTNHKKTPTHLFTSALLSLVRFLLNCPAILTLVLLVFL